MTIFDSPAAWSSASRPAATAPATSDADVLRKSRRVCPRPTLPMACLLSDGGEDPCGGTRCRLATFYPSAVGRCKGPPGQVPSPSPPSRGRGEGEGVGAQPFRL